MPSDPSPHFAVESADGVTFITPTGPQIAADARDPLYAAADDLANSPPPRRVVLDLHHVKSLNSATIGVLINLQKRVRDAGGALKLCALDPFVMNVVQLTRMDQVLDVRGSRKDAVDSFHNKPSASAGASPSWVSRFFGGK
jgi:anti-anti-sigma factor